nr:G-type lectin S-receptor-like serine/threonine-protein kinase LECRK3 [Quercus suber]
MTTSTLSHFCSLLLLLLLLPDLLPTVFTYTRDNCTISLDSPLETDSRILQSPSGEFAFGFYRLESNESANQFLLAVWFHRIKDQTIVWSANGNEPAPPGSVLKKNSNSELVLNDQQGNELWKAPSNGSKSSCAAILDSGNLVILDENNNSVWESFKDPNDTILPGQILYVDTILRSRQSLTNYSVGRFQLSLQPDGNVVLYSLNMPSGILEKPYFATYTMNWEPKLMFTEAGYLYVQDAKSNSTFNLTKRDPGSNKNFYHMARIDYDGIFRLYKHLKNEDATSCGNCPLSWTVVQGIPDDICAAFAGYYGGGFCGPNSICTSANNSIAVFCQCPNGFSPMDQSNNWLGCKPNFALPSCDSGWEANKELVNFIELPNTDWQSSDYNLLQGPGMNKSRCIQECVDDCLCAVAVYEDVGQMCRKKLYPLLNGRQSPETTRISFVKLPKGYGSDNKKGHSETLVLALLLGSSAFLNILLFLAIFVAVYCLYHKKQKLPWNIDSTFTTNVRSYTYKELEEATRGFKQTVGNGAFGTVYKGVLPSDSKRFVAVKKLGKVIEEGEKEFKTEVSTIGQTHHKNLVRLLGYCDEGQHRLLVYEYMSNGSLANFLFGISRPHWNQRVQIAFGIAKGLMYLHEECNTQIIHCDIKPQNILLDEYFTPRIADFGLAKLLLAEQTRAARTGIRGTVGYFAPEWLRKASISVKVDVYSFGVMLLEIICCKSSVAFSLQDEEGEALIDWAYNCYKDKKLDKLIENDEEASNDMKRLERLVIVAIWCIQEDPSLRPSMKKVTQMLEGVIEVFVPPKPSLYTSSPPSKLSSFIEFPLSTVESDHLG